MCDGFWSYFLFTQQVDWQVFLVIHFTMLSPWAILQMVENVASGNINVENIK